MMEGDRTYISVSKLGYMLETCIRKDLDYQYWKYGMVVFGTEEYYYFGIEKNGLCIDGVRDPDVDTDDSGCMIIDGVDTLDDTSS